MKQNFLEKIRSWPLWLAIAALVVFIVQQVWGLDIQEDVNGALEVALPVLVLLGIVNNPNSRDTL